MIPVSIMMQLEGRSESAAHKEFMIGIAMRKFKRAYTKSWLHKLWGLLTQQSSRILDLKQIKASVDIHGRHYEGLQTVPIEQIRGSENRTADFDLYFNPVRLSSRSRWVNIATVMLQGAILPPVELIKIGDTYFVRDGHHRISAARAIGQKEIDATVTSWEVNEKN